MLSDECMAIKVAMAKVAEELDSAPTPAEELELRAEMTRLKSLWEANNCGGGIDWEGLIIDPPTEDEIKRVNKLMADAGQATVDAMDADAITDAVIKVVEMAGGNTA